LNTWHLPFPEQIKPAEFCGHGSQLGPNLPDEQQYFKSFMQIFSFSLLSKLSSFCLFLNQLSSVSSTDSNKA
jgi:hypothetical protein